MDGKENYRPEVNSQRLLKRSCESLLGLVSGVLADGHLHDKEIDFLLLWLEESREIAERWPGDVIHSAITTALADGHISDAERQHLVEVLTRLVGTDFEATGAASGISTSLPIDENAVVVVPGRTFCFTGNFVTGPRAKCEELTEAAGGTMEKSVVKSLDFLVIGALASPDWKNTSYGAKIEKAVENQRQGRPVRVVSERAWAAALQIGGDG